MKFQIPFILRAPPERTKQKAKFFSEYIRPKRNSHLKEYLGMADFPLNREEYLGLVIRSFLIIFFIILIITTTIFVLLGVTHPYIYSLIVALMFGIFISSTQLAYPKLYASRRQRNIEKNLMSGLNDMYVQFNSGIPMFTILVNISLADYGELSAEFKKAVRKINTGMSQTEVLDEMGKRNTSIYFRRTIWQLSNGMKAGSDMVVVVKDIITSLNEEQLLQIQNYGNKLNPLIMFYMLSSVIMPALAIAFLTIITSLVNLEKTMTFTIFIGLFVVVVLIQSMFLGLIRSLRPSLL